MTEPTQAAKQRACNLANTQLPVGAPSYFPLYDPVNVGVAQDGTGDAALTALAELCQDNDKAASEALGYLTHHDNCTSEAGNYQVCGCGLYQARAALAPFILPAPDVLVEALAAISREHGKPKDAESTVTATSVEFSELLRAALAKRGHEVAPIGGKG